MVTGGDKQSRTNARLLHDFEVDFDDSASSGSEAGDLNLIPPTQIRSGDDNDSSIGGRLRHCPTATRHLCASLADACAIM